MSRIILPLLAIFLFTAAFSPLNSAQEKATQDKTNQEKTQEKPAPQATPAKRDPNRIPTGEEVAESTVYVYGSRGLLEQIRRNGIERGRIVRVNSEGRTEEATYEKRFIRGADASKDKIRIDQKMPTMEYSLVFGEGHIWGIINGSNFTPRQDAAASFMSQQWHSIAALLRYKENGSTVKFVEKTKSKGLDLYVVDLIDKEQHQTRYYVSVNTLHVLWLEYEEPPDTGGSPIKFTRKFHNYRYAQGTLVPYRSVLWADDKQLQETNISSVTYGVKMEDSYFQNPEAQANNP